MYGGVAGERAVIVEDEGDRGGVGEKRLVSPQTQVLLAEGPFEAIGERHELLHDLAARLGVGEDPLGRGRRWMTRLGFAVAAHA
jgi:hypothetical protein